MLVHLAAKGYDMERMVFKNRVRERHDAFSKGSTRFNAEPDSGAVFPVDHDVSE